MIKKAVYPLSRALRQAPFLGVFGLFLLMVSPVALAGSAPQAPAQLPTQAQGVSYSDTVDSQDIKGLAAKLKDSRDSLLATDEEKRKILAALYSLNKQMQKTSKEKSHLTDQLIHGQDSVKSLAKTITQLQSQIDSQRNQLKRRLRALYKLSGEGYLKIIFSQNTAPEIDRAMTYLKIITDSDYQLIKNYQKNITEFRNKTQKLNQQVAKLLQIEKKIKSQEGRLVEEHKAKSKIVQELDTSKITLLKNMQSLRTQTEKIKAHLSSFDETMLSLLKPSFFENKGALPPPVTGEVVRDFGLIRDDKYPVRMSHKGWQLKAPKGAPVQAVFDGQVIFSSLVKGYGHTVIIDHGDHYYSVYSNTQRIRNKVGESVHRGQAFAEVGVTNPRFGDGIYFEIRHFSDPENPRNWIALKEIKLTAAADEPIGD